MILPNNLLYTFVHVNLCCLRNGNDISCTALSQVTVELIDKQEEWWDIAVWFTAQLSKLMYYISYIHNGVESWRILGEWVGGGMYGLEGCNF
jgi:hypothetical protein